MKTKPKVKVTGRYFLFVNSSCSAQLTGCLFDGDFVVGIVAKAMFMGLIDFIASQVVL